MRTQDRRFRKNGARSDAVSGGLAIDFGGKNSAYVKVAKHVKSKSGMGIKHILINFDAISGIDTGVINASDAAKVSSRASGSDDRARGLVSFGRVFGGI